MEVARIIGCCTVLAILLLRLLLGRRVPRRIFVLLWAGALLILLLPSPISSRFSVYSLFSGAETTISLDPAAGSAATSASAFWSLLRRIPAALGLLAFAGSWLLGSLRLRRAVPADALAVRDWMATHPLLRPYRICVGQVPAPVCCGVLFPRIVLPPDLDLEDRETLDCVLSHEYVHLCRYDPLLKLLLAVAVCLRWYDPFVWIAALTASRDMEYACDEAVLDAGIDPRRYAAVLLRAALRRTERLPAAARFNAGKTERRVARIISHRSRSPLSWLAAVVMALSLLLCLGTAPKSAQAAPDPAPVEFLASDQAAVHGPDVWTWDTDFPTLVDHAVKHAPYTEDPY